jgi:twitching motility protein PilT
MTTENPADTHSGAEHEPVINKYFRAAIKTGASDLHLKVGQVPKLRMAGQLKNTTGEVLTEEKIEQMIFEILTKEQKKALKETGTIDFAYEIGEEDRFRINVFKQKALLSLAARRVSAEIPPFESLNLPLTLAKIAEHYQGLVLVVGPTGCGKTTSIAAMIDHINKTRSCHIITIEDPIEYLFKDKKSIVSQREIGIDVPDFEEALKYLMREDPDVVFIGEMRDSKTVTAAMRAAETGHLVFGTMHSPTASQAVERLVDLFEKEQRPLAREMFASTLIAIIAQILIPSTREDADRVPAVEILLNNPSVRKLICEERERDLNGVIRSSKEEGMVDLTDSLRDLIKNGSIEPKEAYKYAPNTEELKMAIKGVRTSTSGIL